MSKLPRSAALAVALPLLLNPLQAQAPPTPKLEVAVMTDTHGVEIAPWLRQLRSAIRANWAGDLQATHSDATISVTVAPDGSITAMHLDESSHESRFNRAAWKATSAALEANPAPLPAGLESQSLKLRLHFVD